MKRVYSFGNGVAEGAGLGKETSGRQGCGPRRDDGPRHPRPARLHDRDLGLRRRLGGERISDGIRAEVETALLRLEHDADKHFGDPQNPLLVSVRSGARSSMPGMMDTILNLGLTTRSVRGLAASPESGSPWTAGGGFSRCTATWSCASRGTSSRRP